VDIERCDSNTHCFKHDANQLADASAGRVCEDKGARETIQLLNALTSALIVAETERDSLDRPRTSDGVGERETGRILQGPNVVYYPEDLQLLGRIFDLAIAALPEALQTPTNRSTVANFILSHAVITEGRLHVSDPTRAALCSCRLIKPTSNPCACSS